MVYDGQAGVCGVRSLSEFAPRVRTRFYAGWPIAFSGSIVKDALINALNSSLKEFRMEIKGTDPPAYQVTKAALNAFTRTLAGVLRHAHILVNAVPKLGDD